MTMLKREWKGRYVEVIERLESKGGAIYEVGTVMKVMRNFGGLNLSRIEECKKCFCKGRSYIAGVSERKVKLLPEDFVPPNDQSEYRK